MQSSPLAPLALLLLLLLAQAHATAPTVFRPVDITGFTLYSSAAKYAPQSCPDSVMFVERATFSERLGKLVLMTDALRINDQKCKADVKLVVFKPIGETNLFPQQWLFEDSTFQQRAVNFTCGKDTFAIRFGYFNDIETKFNGGRLDEFITYFDFAVFPYTNPFGFCSFGGRRVEGGRPVEFAPFPNSEEWRKYKGISETQITQPQPQNTTNDLEEDDGEELSETTPPILETEEPQPEMS